MVDDLGFEASEWHTRRMRGQESERGGQPWLGQSAAARSAHHLRSARLKQPDVRLFNDHVVRTEEPAEDFGLAMKLDVQ